MTDVSTQPLSLQPQIQSSDALQSRDTPRFWLRPHIYICPSSRGVFFLDTRRDRYFGLSGIQLRALEMVVEDWPSQPAAHEGCEPPVLTDAMRIADQYVEAGVLTRERAEGKSARPVALDLKADLVAADLTATRAARPTSVRDIAHFVMACLSAACGLRLTSFESVVQRVSARKRVALQSGATFDPDTAIALASVFRRLRTFLFIRQDQCLFQALALTHFLARYNLYPTWVIGVRTDPWAAHSWVQEGNLVLDATPETIRFYTPILAV